MAIGNVGVGRAGRDKVDRLKRVPLFIVVAGAVDKSMDYSMWVSV